MELLVPVAFGLEATVKRQLIKLGYSDCPAENGRILIKKDCDWSDVAKLNVFLRSGERVLLSLGSRKVTTFDELFDFVYSLPWENYLCADSKILLDGKSYKSALAAVKAAGGVVKKAIVKRMIAKVCPYRKALAESGARTVVGVSLWNDVASITLDTSGDGLHKRGYRVLPYTAPLKETTAAAMLDMSYFGKEKPFADLFCGSGTLPIEATMKALNIAPGKNRDFDFAHWKCADASVLTRAKEEANDLEDHSVRPDVYGADISKEAIRIARYHAERAGVAKYIRFETADMRRFKSEKEYGVIVSNPPYGERLCDEAEVKVLYKDLGMVYRNLPKWSIYVLTSYSGFERWFARRADRKKKIYNANLECNYYTYAGEKPPREKGSDKGENKDE